MEHLTHLQSLLDRTTEKVRIAIDKSGDEIAKGLTKEIVSRVELPPEATLLDPNLYKYDTVGQYNTYVNSIKGTKTVEENETVITVGSDYTVYWDKISSDVPFGVFIEWGTGPIGERTNTYPHGYDYSNIVPWDAATNEQANMFNEWGLSAHPHFTPGFNAYKRRIKETIRKAIKEEISK